MAAHVVDDAGEAARLVASGEKVVLIVEPDGPVVDVVPAAGRLALFAGSPADPEVRARAAEMWEELFGSR